MHGSLGVFQPHGPCSEFLPDLLVLRKGQVAERPVVDLPGTSYHVLLLQGLSEHQPKTGHSRQVTQRLLKGRIKTHPLLRLKGTRRTVIHILLQISVPDLIRAGEAREGTGEEGLPLGPGEQPLRLEGIGPAEDVEAGSVIALDLVGCQHAVEADCTQVHHSFPALLVLEGVGVLGICSLLSPAGHLL